MYPLKFFDDFGGNKSVLIHLNLFHNGSKFWRQSLKFQNGKLQKSGTAKLDIIGIETFRISYL